MTQKNSRLQTIPDGQKIKFRDKQFGYTVEAPLPETFGFSVGSEIGTPFAGYASEGTLAKLIALRFGVTNRIGLVTRKIYQGPEPTEMSFDLTFNAYYSSRTEVILPIVKLMIMSVGRAQDLSDARGKIAEQLIKITTATEGIISDAIKFIGLADDDIVEEGEISQLIRFMRAPSLCGVSVGNVFKIRNAYISNVTPTFSNVLDRDFLPLHATCSVTVQLEQPMTKVTLAQSFADAVQLGSETTGGGRGDVF